VRHVHLDAEEAAGRNPRDEHFVGVDPVAAKALDRRGRHHIRAANPALRNDRYGGSAAAHSAAAATCGGQKQASNRTKLNRWAGRIKKAS